MVEKVTFMFLCDGRRRRRRRRRRKGKKLKF
jgi:hypothetical protein